MSIATVEEAPARVLAGWDPFPGLGPGLDLGDCDAATARLATQRMLSPDFEDWTVQAARVGYCAHPVRLRGHSDRVDTTTGEVLHSYSSADEPFGVTYVRCGNRRASACPSYSRLYAADTFHLIRAGVAGGKGVPASVGDNPLVFATLTAPSFGPVHGTRGNHRACRPYAAEARCRHGRAATCHTRHEEGDPLLGQPLCVECYEYTGHVVWQWWAPELWRRFAIALRRLVAHHLGVTETKLRKSATVQYAKVAEYQRRGLIHFHALIRLDGPATDQGFASAPEGFAAADLADLVHAAAKAVHYPALPVHDGDKARVLRFGRQVDARPVRVGHRTDDPGRALAPEQVAGYLAKYATKSAADTVEQAGGNPHLRRLARTANELADRVEDDWVRAGLGADLKDAPYGLLGKWATALGFRGHFATKSRRYAVTLGALRRARRRAQALITDATRTGQRIDLAAMEAQLLADDDQDQTSIVIGQWAYAGTGWDTDGDAQLAKAAAARAREYDQVRAEERGRES